MSTGKNSHEGKYGAFTTGDGDTVIYNRENEDEFVQSNKAVQYGPTSGTDAAEVDRVLDEEAKRQFDMVMDELEKQH